MKNFRSFIQYPAAVFFVLVAPCLYLFLSFYVLSTSIHSLEIGLVNSDAGVLGNMYVSLLDPTIFKMFDDKTHEYLSSTDTFTGKLGLTVMGCYFLPCAVVVFNLFIEKIRGHLEMSITLELEWHLN